MSHNEADTCGGAAATTRRSFAEDVLKVSIGCSFANLALVPAYASGGATAGGAYLLSGRLDWSDVPILIETDDIFRMHAHICCVCNPQIES